MIEEKRVERLEELAPRMREVAVLVSEGLSRKRIAEEMILSESTVRGYINKLVRVLGIDLDGGKASVKIARWVWEREHE